MYLESLELIEQLFAGTDNYYVENLKKENQNKEYDGCTFSIQNYTFRSRLAKKTPKKKGYFVVFWKKGSENKNQAYSDDEMPDKLIITVIDKERKGQFIFPKTVLFKKGILRNENYNGKMAMRVYPSWETDLNNNAMKTQQWQKEYFIDMSEGMDAQQVFSLYFT